MAGSCCSASLNSHNTVERLREMQKLRAADPALAAAYGAPPQSAQAGGGVSGGPTSYARESVAMSHGSDMAMAARQIAASARPAITAS